MSKIPDLILQAGCTAYGAEFLNGSGSLGDGIEAAYFAIHDHDDWVRPGPEAWTGEGLPPVGTVCEQAPRGIAEHAREVLWKTVRIVAHIEDSRLSGPVAVYLPLEGPPTSDQSVAGCFRPIRTAEQILEEKRAHEICEIRALLEAEPLNPTLLAYAIHAAGYRKQVQP